MSKKAKSVRSAEASSRRPRKPAAREKQASDRRSAVSRKGERPALHDDPVVDDLFGMVAALTAEISVALDRIATLERLLEQRGVLTAGGVEAYEADEAERVRRRQARDALIQRVFKMLTSEGEGAAKGARR